MSDAVSDAKGDFLYFNHFLSCLITFSEDFLAIFVYPYGSLYVLLWPECTVCPVTEDLNIID